MHKWNLEFVAKSSEGRRYDQLDAEIDRALRFKTNASRGGVIERVALERRLAEVERAHEREHARRGER